MTSYPEIVFLRLKLKMKLQNTPYLDRQTDFRHHASLWPSLKECRRLLHSFQQKLWECIPPTCWRHFWSLAWNKRNKIFLGDSLLNILTVTVLVFWRTDVSTCIHQGGWTSFAKPWNASMVFSIYQFMFNIVKLIKWHDASSTIVCCGCVVAIQDFFSEIY